MGRGEDSTGVVAGSACAVALTVFMCVFGIPMFFTGIALVMLWDEPIYSDIDVDLKAIGIALISVASVCLVVGIVVIILMCTLCGKNNQTAPAQQPTVTVTSASQNQYGMYPVAQGQAAYPVQSPYGPGLSYSQPPPSYQPGGPPDYGQHKQHSSDPAYPPSSGY